MSKLIDLLGFPSASLILGKRGSGKTAFGCLVLEEAHGRGIEPYLFGLPQKKWNLLPDYITPVKKVDDVGDNAAVVMDESYLYAYARDYRDDFNKFLSKLVGVSRQKKWILVFASHTARKLDIGVVLDMDNIIIRQPSWLHMKYERQELRELIKPAYLYFKKCREPVKHAIIYSESGPKVVNLRLPSFWSEELSEAFSGVSVKRIGF